jgi:hypothetical protein
MKNWRCSWDLLFSRFKASMAFASQLAAASQELLAKIGIAHGSTPCHVKQSNLRLSRISVSEIRANRQEFNSF